MRIIRLTLLGALLASACGGDGDGGDAVSSGRACLDDVREGPAPIEVTVAPPNSPIDAEQAQAVLTRFNDSQARVTVSIHDPGWPPERKVSDLYAGIGADIVPIRHLSLRAVVDDAVVSEPPACIGASIDAMTETARSRAVVDGEPWAVPFGSNGLFLLYEREAFEAAGLDPDRPPATVQELLAVARQLQGAGFERPLVTRFPGHPLVDAGLLGPTDDLFHLDAESLEMFEQLRTMAAEGALSADPPPGTPEDMPAIGTDEVVMEIGDLGLIWGIGTALAEGQAPGTTIAVAAVPGVVDPQVTDFGDVFVVAAASSADEQAAAWAFVQWLSEPAQQAELHLFSDLLPTNADAVELDALQDYWTEIPLFAEAWDAMADHGRVTAPPAALPPWIYGDHLEVAIIDVLFNGADPETRLTDAEGDVVTRAEAFEADRTGFFACALGDDPGACDRLGVRRPDFEHPL